MEIIVAVCLLYIKDLQRNKSDRLEENIAILQKTMSTQLGE